MLEEIQIQCPSCGEILSVFVEVDESDYSTIEDCQNCCRPFSLVVTSHDGKIDQVNVSAA